MTNSNQVLRQLASSKTVVTVNGASPEVSLIDPSDIDEFLATELPSKSNELNDIFYRAVNFALTPANTNLEADFLVTFAAVESLLTFVRRQDDYKILKRAEFSTFERHLKKWLKEHPALAGEARKRALIYEKVPELNRFPFSYVFEGFCEHHSLDLSDLWPVVGKHAEWPLTEIRHRLVHGDPFKNRPAEALACAHTHLSWVVKRMLLAVLGWPIARSNVSPENLGRISRYHQCWPAERAKFS